MLLLPVGRVLDLSTNKILQKQTSPETSLRDRPQGTSYIYEVINNSGSIILASYLTEASSIIGIYPDNLSKHLDKDSNSKFVKVKSCKIRRVPIQQKARYLNRLKN